MKTITQKQLGDRLRKLRKQAGYTQAQVAEKLGVSNETLSRLERGTQWTDFKTFNELAKLYRVEWVDLMSVISVQSNPSRNAVVQEIVELLKPQKLATLEKARDLLRVFLKEEK